MFFQLELSREVLKVFLVYTVYIDITRLQGEVYMYGRLIRDKGNTLTFVFQSLYSI